MLRALCLVFAGLMLTPPVWASEPAPVSPRPLASAFDAMQAGRWDKAMSLAERSGPAAMTLVEWNRLRDGGGSEKDVMSFLEAHPDWPGLELMRRKSELAIVKGDYESIIAFFDQVNPQSGRAALGYADALKAKARQGDAEAAIVLAWRTLDLTTDEHNAFMKDWSKLLKPHHKARLDMALWRGLKDVALMLPLVDKETRALAEIRQSIEAGQSKGLQRLKDMPKSAKSNPHVAYALFNRHIKRGEREKAIDVLLRQSRLEDGLGEPERWAGWRRALARDLMRDGEAQKAYDIASSHDLAGGSNFADLEWLAGFLALTDLDNPGGAVVHFQTLMDGVETPISLGRAGYWLGRAHETLGDEERAILAYELGALHQTSFYGLLAAERGGFAVDPKLAGNEEFPDWRSADFNNSDVFQAGILLHANGQVNLAERFFRHLALSLNRTELGQLGDAMSDLGSEHLQVMISKTAARRGIALPRSYYPIHPLAKLDLPVPAELSLAIARRESEFDQSVTSGVGAMGLMQLMPATASEMARAISAKDHSRARVYEDWRYNAQLGSEYLARMARRFDGNIIMMAAAYNAGPSRPVTWIERFGDPRVGHVDMIDWIEHIPFNETRNYVMRVAESLPVYRARLGRDPHPVPFSQELRGSTFVIAGE